MSILDQKINQTDIETAGVASLPDVLTGSAQENKMLFDRLVREVVSQRFNAVLEQLCSLQGAEQIGAAVAGMEAQTVQGILSRLKKELDELVLQSGSVSSVFGRAGSVVAQAGDYTPQQVGATPAIHIAQVTLPNSWQKKNNNWVQPFVHTLLTANTQVNLLINADLLQQMRLAGTAGLYVENNDGTAKVVAVGNPPAAELQLQAEFVEVVTQ